MKDRIDEREKWNKIYSSQDIDTFGMEYPFGEFDKEFQETVTQLLPNGGKIIEIGSGGGWQSLFLAKTGIFDVTLLDFSEQALQFSKSLFAKEGLQAKFVHRDAFIFGEPEYDLVFNAGVLEHYNFAEQLKLIRAMASYSRKFVLVLTPNTSCYWYWVWRINLSYKGEWLYGKEIPIITMADLFEQSGLIFVGEKFMGSSWTKKFIEDIEGIDSNLRNMIINIHNSNVIPISQKGYLLAALGMVPGYDGNIPSGWGNDQKQKEYWDISELIAALADMIAINLQTQSQLLQENQRLGKVNDELEKIKKELSEIHLSETWQLAQLLLRFYRRYFPVNSIQFKALSKIRRIFE